MSMENEIRTVVEQLQEEQFQKQLDQKLHDLEMLKVLGEELRLKKRPYVDLIQTTPGRGKHRTPKKTYFSK